MLLSFVRKIEPKRLRFCVGVGSSTLGKPVQTKQLISTPPHPPGMIPVYCDSLTVKGKSPVSLVIIRFRNVLYERNRK